MRVGCRGAGAEEFFQGSGRERVQRHGVRPAREAEGSCRGIEVIESNVAQFGGAGAVEQAQQACDVFAGYGSAAAPSGQEPALLLQGEDLAGKSAQALAFEASGRIDQDKFAAPREGEKRPAAGQTLAGVGRDEFFKWGFHFGAV